MDAVADEAGVPDWRAAIEIVGASKGSDGYTYNHR